MGAPEPGAAIAVWWRWGGAHSRRKPLLSAARATADQPRVSLAARSGAHGRCNPGARATGRMIRLPDRPRHSVMKAGQARLAFHPQSNKSDGRGRQRRSFGSRVSPIARQGGSGRSASHSSQPHVGSKGAAESILILPVQRLMEPSGTAGRQQPPRVSLPGALPTSAAILPDRPECEKACCLCCRPGWAHTQ